MMSRRRKWIDARVQGALVGRIVIYWLAAVLYFGTGIAVSQYCDHPDWTLGEHWQAWLATSGPWIPSTCLLLPIVIYDIVCLSHTFSGPIYRLRQQLRKLIQSPNCSPMVLREDDHWKDLIAPLNALQNQILSLHMALKVQRETIDELRSGRNMHDSASKAEANAGEQERDQTDDSHNHLIAQVVETTDHMPESIGAAS